MSVPMVRYSSWGVVHVSEGIYIFLNIGGSIVKSGYVVSSTHTPSGEFGDSGAIHLALALGPSRDMILEIHGLGSSWPFNGSYPSETIVPPMAMSIGLNCVKDPCTRPSCSEARSLRLAVCLRMVEFALALSIALLLFSWVSAVSCACCAVSIRL